MIPRLYSARNILLLLAGILSGAFTATAQGTQPKLGDYVQRRLFDAICPVRESAVAKRAFAEYGAVFAAENVRPPAKCVYADEAEVQQFQKTLVIKDAVIRGFRVELQKAAMESLLEALAEANAKNIQLTPLDGTIAGRRSYFETVRIWNSRFLPALDHWVQDGRITPAEADEMKAAVTVDQVAKVMDWEGKGVFFGPGYSRSIFSSVAPPGTSQHLALMAIDIVEHDNPDLREILMRHGWYQTIKDDVTHFTYLGVPETELPARGLKLLTAGNFRFWLPNVE